MGAGFCAWLAAAAPRWLAALALPAEDVGYFVLAGNLSLVVSATLGGIVFNYTFPSLFAAAREGADAQRLLRMTNRAVLGVMAGTQAGLLALRWIAPWLLGVIIHPRYADAIDWLVPTGGAALAATTTQFYHNVLIARRRESDCLRLSIFSAALRLVMMAAASQVSVGGFRAALIALPWVSVIFEAWYVQRRVRSPAAAA
jgi:O-antigen/teichoic acid export membrane protein